MASNTEKTISVREFRMWLQGVEEMQDDDWTPSPQQWKRIRDKINNIDGNAATVTKPTPAPQPPLQYAQAAIPTGPIPRVPEPTLAGPSSMAFPQHPQLNPLLAGSGGQVKTPDIDTSAKGYESGFV